MKTVTVFGSCNMDLVAYVPVAPRSGETVHGRAFRTVPGGKGANQAIAAAKAGATSRFVGTVGSDGFGEQIRDALAETGVDTAGLRTVEGNSGTAHIVVDDEGANSIVVVAGANASTGRPDEDVERLIASSSCLLLQLETPLEGVTAAAEMAAAHGVRVVLTPAPAEPLPDSLLSKVDLLVPNEHEAAVLTGQDDPELAADALLDSVEEVAITLGERGVLCADRTGRWLRVPAFPVRAVDTTAAGDTFVGALGAALAGDESLERALREGSAAAALSIGREGASSSMPSAREISEFLENDTN